MFWNIWDGPLWAEMVLDGQKWSDIFWDGDSQLNTIFWTVDYMTMLEHNLYTNWMVFLKINPTLTPKKTYVKFCCVGRNHTSLKNTCTTSTYFLQSKPLLVDPRECSLMNLTNLIITMMAHTDYSVNNFLLFSSSYSLPAFQPFPSAFFVTFPVCETS